MATGVGRQGQPSLINYPASQSGTASALPDPPCPGFDSHGELNAFSDPSDAGFAETHEKVGELNSSRFLVHMDHVHIANHPHRPLSPEALRRRRLESVGDLVPSENALARFPLYICCDLIRKDVGLSTLQPLLPCLNRIKLLLRLSKAIGRQEP
jgi:hypothetical protein